MIATKGEAQSSSIAWEISQLYRRVSEWLEWQVSRLRLDFPDLPEFSWFNQELLEWMGAVFFWTLLGLLIVLILTMIIAYANNLKKSRPKSTVINSKNELITVDQWLKRSLKYAEEKNYHTACVCLYQGMLQLLDDRRLIPQQMSRTDGEYWRLIEGFSQPLPYQTLLLTHQSLCFGNVKASVKTWENCYQAYQQISQFLP
ncbi:MAG: DUF4129 domain-containing protein [Gloeocapsa sp. DLM2.Bin57]|nr:MAG: DUF4129 domain-containing protein [Gloeocapsa sp. DLM2.Bin57]